MSKNHISPLISRLTDWLIALCGAGLLIWFVITQPIFTRDIKNSSNTVDLSNLKKHVKLLTVGYAPRTINYGNLEDTAKYIFRQFQYIGNPQYQALTTLSNQYKNVILQLGPDTDEVFVIGAHYDARDDSIDTEGNASGIAALIELGRHLSKESYRLKNRIELVAYPLSLNQSDEMSTTGSYYHAKSLKQKGKKVHLMISLDSVGQFNSEAGSQKHAYSFLDLMYPSKGNYVNLIGRIQDFKFVRLLKKGFIQSTELPLHSQLLPENFVNANIGDHVSYWREGYPAVLITDTEGYRTPIDSKLAPKDRLDYQKMALLVGGLYQAMMQVAGIEQKWKVTQRARNHISRRIVN